jgi:NAD(P)-dependent dehydrogenase (short-subunit alcohol dehydrogenase family)
MEQMYKLEGKVALVTGAGSGIGQATAVLLAQHGAKVAALGRTQEELEETIAEIEKNDGEGLLLLADIAQAEEMETAVEQIINTWGRLDIVFANAGINGVWAPIEQLEVEEFRQTLDTNLTGTFITIKCAVPHLKKQGGAVVITSSVNGTRIFSNPGATAYSCSKAAQVTMMKMLALELAQDKIRVNAICPGAIETNIEESTEKRNVEKARVPGMAKGGSPLTDGKPGTAEQVAQLVLFLVSDASNHISGTELWIDGAQSLLQG